MIESLPLLAWPRKTPLLTVLIYHRVLAEPEELREGEVDARLFEMQMAFLARNFSVLSLTEAIGSLKAGQLAKRACCITFDDGYADNLTLALPILERHGLPATVFVATAYLDGGRMFNDTSIEIIARCRAGEIDLTSIGLERMSLGTPEARKLAVRALQMRLKYLNPAEREQNVKRAVALADCGPLPNDLMLSTEQLRELSRRGVEIGGHTDAHAILTTLDNEGALREIRLGKQTLERVTGKPVTSFAYPNGWPGRDFGAEHVALVRDLGFKCAVTTAPGVACVNDDPYQIPRFIPWGRPTARFALRMLRNANLGAPAAAC